MLELKKINFEKESYNLSQTDEERNKILFEILELNELIDEIDQVLLFHILIFKNSFFTYEKYEKAEQIYELEMRVSQIIKPFEIELAKALNSSDYSSAVKIIAKLKYYQNIYERLINLKLKFELTNF